MCRELPDVTYGPEPQDSDPMRAADRANPSAMRKSLFASESVTCRQVRLRETMGACEER
jgi:hypothetical protein